MNAMGLGYFLAALWVAGTGARDIPPERMQAIYDEVKTPYKYGIVIPAPAGKKVDCPTVFRHKDRWYMVYVQLENEPQGYTTQLAESDDLLHWQPKGTILPRGDPNAWDKANAAGGIALFDTKWGGDGTLETYDGRYWMSYIGGANVGYEKPPLAIGAASTLDPTAVGGWEKLPSPILRPNDADVRPFETETLFKSFILHDPKATLGAPFVMYYNARPARGDETIGMAVSQDMRTWRRYGDGPVIVHARPADLKHGVISGDPQVVRMDDLWVMFHFGAFWKPKAFDTFAASRDLVHWTQWDGPHLIEPSQPWDNEFAHKPWILKHDGVVYHFYCAVGDQGRAIALATSKPVGSAVPTHSTAGDDLVTRFQNPPPAASPWVYWYWMRGAVSREGITADLEAMKAAGIGGAYLFTVQGATNPPLFDPPVATLTPEWWAMVRHAMSEADRLGLQLGMHACDGFSVGGGPWITPELSMQKVVWTEIQAAGGKRFDAVLPQPPTLENFYRDIAVLAFPSPMGAGVSTRTVALKVTSSVPGMNAQSLVAERSSQRFRSDAPCWIQYAFDRPFTCRSITVYPDGTSFQPLRLRIEVSDDRKVFRFVEQLEPPRHGWQNQDAGETFAIAPTTARFFRFVCDPAGSEPGSEDLDSAKWRPTLRVQRIELSSEPRIHQFEGKTGQVWRISRRTTPSQVPDETCVPLDRIVDITQHMDGGGRLQWDVPDGNWTLLRLGHTSTGHRNTTGGGASVGLECDKFNPDAARLQFDRWFGEVFRQVGPELAGRVLKMFHVDSWEAGSQNWSPVFRAEFKQRRGYDPLLYLPTMAGIPVGSANDSERFLHDVRTTIAELVVDNFFGPMAELAHSRGCTFSAENVAPTMTSDSLRHFGVVDIPMGEFWFRSPTHDKPNDMLDAISAAHIYGKPIVQAEAFTELRFAWDEHPAMVKALGDRNLALGINRLVFHVFVHNPWLDRRPGMTLGPTGLFFQRDQTWWRPARAWVDYLRRCQALLQVGRPVVDVAVFTGEEIPSRAVLPERLVPTLPGIFGAEIVQREADRLANKGQPQRELPKGVTSSANISDPADWIDPLHGYAYDSINRDALLRLAKVRNGRIELPDGASYAVLVLPGPHPMSPDAGEMSSPATERLAEWTAAGVTVIDGRRQPFKSESFDSLGVHRDFAVTEVGANNHSPSPGIAWTHRATPDADIYFISNQQDKTRVVEISLRVSGRVPELWDPMTGRIAQVRRWRTADGRTILPLRLDPSGSVFVVLRGATTATRSDSGSNWIETRVVQEIEGPWQVAFDSAGGGPGAPTSFLRLEDWSHREEAGVRHYSGTAVYSKAFEWSPPPTGGRVWLDLGDVANIAEVVLNGQECGVAWTDPFRVEIMPALHAGSNRLEIRVTNTWANRLIGDRALPEAQRTTWTTGADRVGNGSLLRAGLLGPVQIVMERQE